MTDRSSTTRCNVKIVTPNLVGRPSQTYEWKRGGGELGGLMAVSVATDISISANRFQLVFAPEHLGTPDSWAERIPQYSLVFIEMHRAGRDGDDPTVMIGLTDRPVETENFGGPVPKRQTVIPGRGIEGVLEDARVWFAPFLETHKYIEAGLDRVTSVAFREQLSGRLMWASKIFGENADPRRAVLAVLFYYLLNHGSSVTNLLLPSPYLIRELLVPGNYTDADIAVALASYVPGDTPRVAPPSDWTLLDDRMVIPVTSTGAHPGSVLDLLGQLLDLQLHEFFVRYSGRRARILHRAKPFALPGEVEALAGTVGASQFSRAASELESIEINQTDVIQSQLRHGTDPIHNAFLVTPGQSALVSQAAIKANVAPEFAGRETDHAYVGRYGIRPLEHRSPYMVVSRDGAETADILGTSRRLSSILKHWFDPHPRMYSGTILALGRAEFRAGQRLVWHAVDSDGRSTGRQTREFYVTGVQHKYDFATGAFGSTLNVIRGWPLARRSVDAVADTGSGAVI